MTKTMTMRALSMIGFGLLLTVGCGVPEDDLESEPAATEALTSTSATTPAKAEATTKSTSPFRVSAKPDCATTCDAHGQVLCCWHLPVPGVEDVISCYLDDCSAHGLTGLSRSPK